MVCGPPARGRGPANAAAELPKDHFIVEPCARNTAPCVGLAALHVAARDPQGRHGDAPGRPPHRAAGGLPRGARRGAQLAERGAIATIGIRPTRPETGYGYLKVGPRLAARGKKGKPRLQAYKVERFVEKPDAVTAARYLADGGYLWNSGIFVFRADVILEEIRRAMPVLGEQLEAIGAALGTPGLREDAAARLPRVPVHLHRLRRHGEEPADRGGAGRLRLERRGQLRGAAGGARDRRDLGNVAEGDAIVIDGRNNVVLATDGRPVAVVGLDDVVVVDAGDAVLVCRRDRAQDVRKAVEELTRRGRDEVL